MGAFGRGAGRLVVIGCRVCPDSHLSHACACMGRPMQTRHPDLTQKSLAAADFVRLHPGPGRSRREVEADQARRLRRAMVELTYEGGFESVRMRGLSDRSIVSSGSIYRQFANKEQLLVAAYEDIIQTFALGVRRAVRGESAAEDRVVAVAALAAKAAADDRQGTWLVVAEAGRLGWPELCGPRSALQFLAGLVASGLAELRSESTPSSVMVEGVLAGAMQIVRRAISDDEGADVEALAAQLTQWLTAFR